MAAKRTAKKRAKRGPAKAKSRRRVVEVTMLDDDGRSARRLTDDECLAIAMSIKVSDADELDRFVRRMRGVRGVRCRDWVGWQHANGAPTWPDC